MSLWLELIIMVWFLINNMMGYLKYFFSPGHIFSLRPQAMSNRALIILAVAFALLILIGILFKLISLKTKDGLKVKAWRKMFYLFLSMGIVGFIYLFFAWQGVAVLSSRLLLLIIVLVIVVWLAFILHYLLFVIPKLRKDIEEKRKYQKYIP